MELAAYISLPKMEAKSGSYPSIWVPPYLAEKLSSKAIDNSSVDRN